jgi:S-adenosylmethionine decarboxylase
MKYNPGLHILSEFTSNNISHLSSAAASKELFDNLIENNDLKKVGEVYHDFDSGGFTAVVCLTESHLSIHTWPEYQLATFDIFLSNYKKDNTEKVERIYAAVLDFFEGVEKQKTKIIR